MVVITVKKYENKVMKRANRVFKWQLCNHKWFKTTAIFKSSFGNKQFAFAFSPARLLEVLPPLREWDRQFVERAKDTFAGWTTWRSHSLYDGIDWLTVRGGGSNGGGGDGGASIAVAIGSARAAAAIGSALQLRNARVNFAAKGLLLSRRDQDFVQGLHWLRKPCQLFNDVKIYWCTI